MYAIHGKMGNRLALEETGNYLRRTGKSQCPELWQSAAPCQSRSAKC